MILVKPTARSARRTGFTLVEVMIVAAIVVVLASLGTVYLVRYLDEAKKDTARTKAIHIAKVISIYQAQIGEYPTSLDQLLQPPSGKAFLGREELYDPWNQLFQFSVDANGNSTPEVFTKAPDGQKISSVRDK